MMNMRLTSKFSKKQNREKGQSTVEFLITFAFSFSIMFMFLRLALNYAEGYVVHYATFMASRAFLVHDINATSPGTSYESANATAASDLAKRVVERVYPELSGDKLTVRLPRDTPGPDRNLFIGTYYDFDQNFTLPFSAGGSKTLNMKSESFLGREPTRDVCLDRICKIFQSSSMGLGISDCREYSTLSDNGC